MLVAVLAARWGRRHPRPPDDGKPPAARKGAAHPPARFRWSNPQPQGNTLYGVAIADGVVWSVGDAGTIVRSRDGGPFAVVPSGTTKPLWSVWAASGNDV